MILDLVLSMVIGFLIVTHLIYVHEMNMRFDRLLEKFTDLSKLTKAKDLTDYNVSMMIEKTPKEEPNPDLTPIENIEPEQFEKIVEEETK